MNDKFASPYNSVAKFSSLFCFLFGLFLIFFDLIIFIIIFLLIYFLDNISLRIIWSFLLDLVNWLFSFCYYSIFSFNYLTSNSNFIICWFIFYSFSNSVLLETWVWSDSSNIWLEFNLFWYVLCLFSSKYSFNCAWSYIFLLISDLFDILQLFMSSFNFSFLYNNISYLLNYSFNKCLTVLNSNTLFLWLKLLSKLSLWFNNCIISDIHLLFVSFSVL